MEPDEQTKTSGAAEKRCIQCICPKCAARHRVTLCWAGRGVPRIYCGQCKAVVAGYHSTVDHEVASGRRRRNSGLRFVDGEG